MHKKNKITAGNLAEYLEAEIIGDKDFVITDISEPETATEDNVVYLSNKKFIEKIENSKAKVVVTKKEFQLKDKILILPPDVEIAFIKLLQLFERPQYTPDDFEIHNTAQIHPSVNIGEDTKIMEYVIIRKDTKIGKNCIIYPHTYIGETVSIGNNTIIYPNVTIYDGSVIGNNVIIHSGAVIGSDGFGYTQRKGKNLKIPQIGNVIIEDNVEIGANTTIDRSTIGSTIIKKGVKIDNLVQIAHNVIIGENTVIASQTGISGSTIIGKNCILAGQVGIADHAIIEDNVIVGAKTGVTSRRVKSDEKMVFGIPAKPIMRAKRIEAAISNLPEIIKEIQELKKQK